MHYFRAVPMTNPFLQKSPVGSNLLGGWLEPPGKSGKMCGLAK
jgi:hypothetical protein